MTFQSTAVDTIAVFDSNFNQVFQAARPMKCTARPIARLMEHPLETGQIISDYKIIMPVEVTLPLIVASDVYRDIYAEIYNLMAKSELLMVQTRATNFSNMLISEMPDEERPDMFDVIMIELHLKQVLLVEAASNFSPADGTQVNTQNSGQQSSSPVTLPNNSATNNEQVIKSQFATA